MRVQIRRWSTRVVVPPRLRDRPWRTWCERLIRGPVGRRLLAEILASRLGPPDAPDDDTVILVRQLALRVRVSGRPDDDAVARAWASGLRTELERGLAELAQIPGSMGLASPRIAVFPSALAAEVAALAVRRDAGDAWWAPRVLHARSTAEVVAGWIASAQAEAPGALLAVTGGRAFALASLVDHVAAAALHEALEAAWSGARVWVAPRPDPLTPAVHPEHLALLMACEARRLGGRAAAPQAGPQAWPQTGPQTKPPAPEAAHPDPTTRAAPPAQAPSVTEETVDLAGLLFLLRPLVRHPLLADTPWPQWPGALAAVWAHVDELLFAKLPFALAARIREANAPLVDAFTTAWPPPEPTVEPLMVRRVLSELLSELLSAPRPAELPATRLARALVGPYDPPWDRLAAVVVRPARLRLTETHVDAFLPLGTVDIGLRRAGWDIDPGFVPGLRRVVRFHYGGGR